ncbi:MAG: hypothetical protein LBG77_07120 [Dysgonamonadaceae bacterium]|nr:hypothetical protein [Dysgonamonadaceae bacterium]
MQRHAKAKPEAIQRIFIRLSIIKEFHIPLHLNLKDKIMAAPLDKTTSDKISFISLIVPEFAAAYKMKVQDAYFYLKNTAVGFFCANIGGDCIQ